LTLGITGRRRAKSRWLILGVIVAGLSLAGGSIAFAHLSGSTFEGNDGNLIVDGVAPATDWANVVGLNAGIDVPSGPNDNAFGQGTKEDNAAVTVVTGSIPPNKNDLTRFYEASEFVGGQNFLYLAWERAVNIGNANMDFEINQATTPDLGTAGKHTINRTAGDLLVTYDFPGSGTPVLGLLRWLTSATVPAVPGFTTNVCFSANTFPCWGDHLTLNGSDSEGAVNTGTVLDPIAPDAPRYLTVGLFGEAAINLTTAGVFPAGTCGAFGSTFLKSRSSSSFTAELKDFVAPVAVNIANCGEFKIIKTSAKSGDTTSMAGATFSVTKNDGTAITGSPFKTGSDGTVCVTAVPTGTYTVTEIAAPANYGIDPTPQDVVVASSSSCDSTSTSYAPINFTDTPLSKIQVLFTSLAGEGITKASIVCTTNSGATVDAVSENGIADPAFDDTNESFTNLVPGTYTCTVVVDP
jgi:Prealbumin-like fold domain